MPHDLENELQKARPYGKIVNVTLNAAGGWVMQFDSGDGLIAIGRMLGRRREIVNYSFGGQLPAALKEALEQSRDRRVKITVWWLRILIFSLSLTVI